MTKRTHAVKMVPVLRNDFILAVCTKEKSLQVHVKKKDRNKRKILKTLKSLDLFMQTNCINDC